MNPFQEFLHLLSDPNISFILFTIGFYGLLFELQTPNFVTGILGALAIVLAFIGFGSLPLNIGGLLLILLAMVLFGLELTVTSHGLLGAGGLICFALGASALFTQPGDPFEPLATVALPVVITTTVTAGAFLALIVWAAVHSRGMAAPSGMVGSAATVPPGLAGVVRHAIEPVGSVYVGGEEWSARTVDGSALQRGTPVRVVSTEGLTVIVEPEASPSGQS
jgi:membrane-bound serine protease (ClpP class)